ncbi:hypothetical protein RF11_07045 [Thelohanellus kitauei]|uniref:Tc1-like transposase DDE domain-containing protein n=1 Tax=Thelohanellus kitauei TaxID=669202 RepID=A0A0C2IYW6_THEKT|nr:hypothetical protein RF11_07045 [Thelohanellus kitauei]
MRVKKHEVLYEQRQFPISKMYGKKNISVCCPMDKSGVVYFENNHRLYNKDSFKGYTSHLMNHLERTTVGRCCFIMGNVAFHKCDTIKQEIRIRDHRVEYLPPYSPFSNPIENMFSKWKDFVKRSNGINKEQLLSCMDHRITEISVSDCDGWYRNMKEFIRRSLNREIIT